MNPLQQKHKTTSNVEIFFKAAFIHDTRHTTRFFAQTTMVNTSQSTIENNIFYTNYAYVCACIGIYIAYISEDKS